MSSHLPSPVLSVNADTVKELEGSDTVFTLWALFSKCKNSLKDGRRLENISWCLWYREIVASHSPSFSPSSVSPSLNENRSVLPMAPIAEDRQPAPTPHPSHSLLRSAMDLSMTHSWDDISSTPSSANSCRSSTAIRPKIRPIAPVGKFILEILLDKLDVNTSKLRPDDAQGIFGYPASPSRLPFSQIAQLHPDIALPMDHLSLSSSPEKPCIVVANLTPHPSVTPQKSIHVLSPAFPRAHMISSPPSETSQHTLAALSMHDTLLARGDDSMSKPSDDRSPMMFERDLPESASCIAAVASDQKTLALNSSSATLNQKRLNVPSRGAPEKRRPSLQQGRKKGNVVRRAHSRLPLHRTHARLHKQYQAAQRSAPVPEPRKPSFNASSMSLNGPDEYAAAGPSRVAVTTDTEKKDPAFSCAQPSPRSSGSAQRQIAVSTSFECETTDTEGGSEWASEDDRVGDAAVQETQLRQAAVEVKRQQNMFAKMPRRSYSTFRTRPGLLSQLFNPVTPFFPRSHQSYSTQDMTQNLQHVPTLQTIKSPAAVPLTVQIIALAPATKGTDAYVRKSRPGPEELEESSSAEENPENVVQLSRSLAYQKLVTLAALAGLRRNPARPLANPQMPAHPTLPPATAPIILAHPYNLPAPGAPMTPRETRRHMLSTELSESLRRNLLWERRVNKAITARSALLGKDVLCPLTMAEDYHYAGW